MYVFDKRVIAIFDKVSEVDRGKKSLELFIFRNGRERVEKGLGEIEKKCELYLEKVKSSVLIEINKTRASIKIGVEQKLKSVTAIDKKNLNL